MADKLGKADFSGFLHQQGTEIVDGAGRPRILRGVGLGSWLLPEGYMWLIYDRATAPHQKERLISELIGEVKAQEFWQEYFRTFITREDIALIAADGHDHVRLPLNSRVLIDESDEFLPGGFALVDELIDWCREHKLWVLLDLHGAPGGQTGQNIDDAPNGKPELFMEKKYWDRTIKLWRELATRYRDEPVVAGYDLLNEPLPNEWQHIYKDELVQLYRELTRTIREVDTNHLIMYEGSHWATNWEIFTEVWDSNSVLQFHRYWCAPDNESIAPYLETRDRLQVPIYMGEGGENNPQWVYTAHRLYEDHGIGWNYWPWKKLSTFTSPLSIIPPEDWSRFTHFAQTGQDRPTPEQTEKILWDLLEAVKAERCEIREEVTRAMFARAPLVIPGWGFGFEGLNRSYKSDGEAMPGLRIDESVTIEFVDGRSKDLVWNQTDGRPYSREEALAIRLAPGDWVSYTVHGAQSIEVDHDGEIAVELTSSAARVTAVTESVIRTVTAK